MGDNLPNTDLGSGKTVAGIAARGSTHSCALLNDESVKCWGSGGSGQLGLGSTARHGPFPNQMGDNLPIFMMVTASRAPLPNFRAELPACLVDVDTNKGVSIYPWVAIEKVTLVTVVGGRDRVYIEFRGGELGRTSR